MRFTSIFVALAFVAGVSSFDSLCCVLRCNQGADLRFSPSVGLVGASPMVDTDNDPHLLPRQKQHPEICFTHKEEPYNCLCPGDLNCPPSK